MINNDGVEIWDVYQVAEFLHCSTSKVYKMITENNGPKFYRIGRSIHYHADDVREWYQHCGSPNGTPKNKPPKEENKPSGIKLVANKPKAPTLQSRRGWFRIADRDLNANPHKAFKIQQKVLILSISRKIVDSVPYRYFFGCCYKWKSLPAGAEPIQYYPVEDGRFRISWERFKQTNLFNEDNAEGGKR